MAIIMTLVILKIIMVTYAKNRFDIETLLLSME